MSNPFDAAEFAPAWPPINSSVLWYSMCDEENGGISTLPYRYWYTVALPFAMLYVETLNRMCGRNRFSIKANY